MFRIFVLAIYCISALVVEAQLIDNKLNISISYTMASFPGKETKNEQNFISPSLYHNYSTTLGYSVKTYVRKSEILSLGLSFDNLKASDWESENYLDYAKSSVRLNSLSPIFRVHNRFTEKGRLNKFKLYAEMAPTLGVSHLTLLNPVFETHNVGIDILTGKPLFFTDDENSNILPLIEGKDLYFGLSTGIGVEWSVSQTLSLFLNYSQQFNWISSILYNDSHFSCSKIGAGVVMKFKKDKSFFY